MNFLAKDHIFNHLKYINNDYKGKNTYYKHIFSGNIDSKPILLYTIYHYEKENEYIWIGSREYDYFKKNKIKLKDIYDILVVCGLQTPYTPTNRGVNIVALNIDGYELHFKRKNYGYLKSIWKNLIYRKPY